MKKALITMAVMFVLIVFPGGGCWSLLSNLIGGETAETFLYPIYAGIILLAGLIVGCASLILDEVKKLKEKIKNTDSKRSEAGE